MHSDRSDSEAFFGPSNYCGFPMNHLNSSSCLWPHMTTQHIMITSGLIGASNCDLALGWNQNKGNNLLEMFC